MALDRVCSEFSRLAVVSNWKRQGPFSAILVASASTRWSFYPGLLSAAPFPAHSFALFAFLHATAASTFQFRVCVPALIETTSSGLALAACTAQPASL